MTWRPLRGSWREHQRLFVTRGKVTSCAKTKLKGSMTPVPSVWKMVKSTECFFYCFVDLEICHIEFYCASLSKLIFRALLENYAKHWCALLLNQNSAFAQCHSVVDPDIYHKVQWNVPVCLHFITFWWDCIRLKVFSVLCSDVFTPAVTVRRVRPVCVPCSRPMHEFVHQRECSWQTGERTCAVWVSFY